MSRIVLDRPLRWSEVAAVAADGAVLALSAAARARIQAAHEIVRAVVDRGIRAYGVNTGVGALADVVVAPEQLSALSRNILMSHAVGVGMPLAVSETRAIMASMVNSFAHGYSGLRPILVERLVDLLNADCSPVLPRQGSVGYLSHSAQIGLVLIGHATAVLRGERLPAAAALARLGFAPLVLEAKEGLCLVNGTPCVTGLACLALDRAQRLLDWADSVAAMSFEIERGQLAAVAPATARLRTSPGLLQVATTLERLLCDSSILSAAAGTRTQDALSLRGIPQVHGAARDVWVEVAAAVDRELASVTDNPAVSGSPDAPIVQSEAHSVGTGVGQAMDQIGLVVAQLGMHSESRLARLINPLVSGLPAFLAQDGGVASGFMIAQYVAVSLVGENRRLAAPAGLDGGSTSALQEDMLCHATPAALKALQILDNARQIIAIELLAACQGYDFLTRSGLVPAMTGHSGKTWQPRPSSSVSTRRRSCIRLEAQRRLRVPQRSFQLMLGDRWRQGCLSTELRPAARRKQASQRCPHRRKAKEADVANHGVVHRRAAGIAKTGNSRAAAARRDGLIPIGRSWGRSRPTS